MSLLSHNQLVALVEQGAIEGVKPEAIQGASIDIHLGAIIEYEIPAARQQKIVLRKKDRLITSQHNLKDAPFMLSPGQCILAPSLEKFNLPSHIAAMYQLNSSMGRIFLEHMKAGWCDPTWNGSVLTMELKNLTQHHHIELAYGDRIGQMIFFECEPVPEHRSYARVGRYNGDMTVSGVKSAPSLTEEDIDKLHCPKGGCE